MVGSLLVDLHPNVPPWPHQVLKAYTTPAPPQLDRSAAPDAHVAVLCSAYNHLAHYLWPDGLYPTVRPTRGVTRRLQPAAAKLMEHRTPPMLWGLHQMYRWAARGHDEPPPLAFTWSVKEISAKAGWARQETEDLALFTPRLIAPRARQVLIRRHGLMVQALRGLVGEAADDTRVRSIAEQWFPPGTFKRLAEVANQEAFEKSNRLAYRAGLGHFVWGGGQ